MSDPTPNINSAMLSVVDLAQDLNRKYSLAVNALRHAKEAMEDRDDDGAYAIIKTALKEMEKTDG